VVYLRWIFKSGLVFKSWKRDEIFFQSDDDLLPYIRMLGEWGRFSWAPRIYSSSNGWKW